MTTEEDLLHEELVNQPSEYTSYGPFSERRRKPKILQAIAVSVTNRATHWIAVDSVYRNSFESYNRALPESVDEYELNKLCLIPPDVLKCSSRAKHARLVTSSRSDSPPMPRFLGVQRQLHA